MSTVAAKPATQLQLGVFAARAILAVLMFLTLLPFITMFSAALAPSGTYPPGLQWPADPQWGNFVDAFMSAKLDRLLVSSITIVVCVVPVSVLIGTMAGFGLAKLAPRGSQVVYLLFVVGLTLPLEVVIIPLYYEIQWLGLLNTKFAIILPLIGLFMPFSIYWMRAHFVNVPAEMSEAAQIDGANAWQQFGSSKCPWRDRRYCRWRSYSSCGPGTPSCCHWCWWKYRWNGQWPERSALSKVSGAPTSHCFARDR